MTDAAGLEGLEPWVAGIMARIEPGKRVALARKIGQLLRRVNAKRIAANVEPDGGAMQPRKPRLDRRGRLRAKKGKMFPATRLARNMKITANADEVKLAFTGPVAGVADIHHFGLADSVDRRSSTAPRIRYPARRLLGFAPQDRDAIMDEVTSWLADN